jgi:hypothetical protein
VKTPPSPLVARLLERLTADAPEHDRFKGAPVDITGLTPLELGQLWAPIQRAASRPANAAANAVARSILDQAKRLELEPAFDEGSALDAFRTVAAGNLSEAARFLAHLKCAPPRGVAVELRRILGDKQQWAEQRYKALAIAKHADPATRDQLVDFVRAKYADAPYALEEFTLLDRSSENALLALALPSYVSYYWAAKAQEEGDPAVALAEDPAYVQFAETILRRSLRRSEDIQSGRTPYKADGAFTVEDSHVIARAARVAALRDEPWARDLIPALLRNVCVAPTDANTCPSQSLAIALGHSIQGVPTPESVSGLREALSLVRHASVKKKLSRNLKPAERALAERPEIALRLTTDAKPSKRQQILLATCLEAGFWERFDLSWEEWRKQLAEAACAAELARSVIWRAQAPAQEPLSFLLDDSQRPPSPIDCHARAIQIPASSRVSLWHPLFGDDRERDAWRSIITQRRVRQPIRQAFREYYVPDPDEMRGSESWMFGGQILSLVPLIGLARREGWQLAKEGALIRRFGAYRLGFSVAADLYPGVQGSGKSGDLRFAMLAEDRWLPIAIRDIPAVVFSEMCRAVDLLVSVTSFAVDDPETSAMPLTAGDLGVALVRDTDAGDPRRDNVHPRVARMKRIHYLSEQNVADMARMRREVLARAFAAEIAAGRIALGQRHLTVASHAVHLSTARITRNGSPIEIELPEKHAKLAAVPWLPYDEVLLQKIVDTVAVLLDRT